MGFGKSSAALCLTCLLGFAVGAMASEEPPDASALAVRRIVDAIRSGRDRAQREEAVASLQAMGNSAYPGLRALLKDKNHYARLDGLLGVNSLGIGAAPMINDVIPLLYDEDAVVLSQAVPAVGNFREGSEPAVPRLIELLDVRGTRIDGFIRSSAFMALGRIGRPAKRAVPRLLQELDDPVRLGTREIAIRVLGMLGPDAAEAVPQLAKMLETPLDAMPCPQSDADAMRRCKQWKRSGARNGRWEKFLREVLLQIGTPFAVSRAGDVLGEQFKEVAKEAKLDGVIVRGWFGRNSLVEEPMVARADSFQDLKRILLLHSRSPIPPMEVDFSKESLVAIFFGRDGAMVDMKLESVSEDPSTVTITTSHMDSDAIQVPGDAKFFFIALPRTRKTVVIKRRWTQAMSSSPGPHEIVAGELAYQGK